MNREDGIKLILDSKSKFNNRYNKPFGQIILRLDYSSYLMSDENLQLDSILENNIKEYKAKTGVFGKVFRNRSDVNAIVFLYTETSIAFSKTNKFLKPALMDLAEIVGPKVKVIEKGSAGSILRAIKSTNACIVKNSGILAIGKDLPSAISTALVVDKSIQAEIYGEKLGGIKYISAGVSKSFNKYYSSDYSMKNIGTATPFIPYDEEETKLRNKIVETAIKLSDNYLVQGTWGNVSIKLNEDEMLITPSAIDYYEMKPEDIVKVNLKSLNYSSNGRIPSSETKLHKSIYDAKEDCNAIIHTHSIALSIFAAANAGFRITNKQMNDLIGNVNISEFALPSTDRQCESVTENLEKSNAVIMANHGAIFTAKDLDTAFIIADATETKAGVLLDI